MSTTSHDAIVGLVIVIIASGRPFPVVTVTSAIFWTTIVYNWQCAPLKGESAVAVVMGGLKGVGCLEVM